MGSGVTTVLVGIKELATDVAAVRADAREAAAAGASLRLLHAFTWPLFPGAGGEQREQVEEEIEAAAGFARTIDAGPSVSAAAIDGGAIPVLLRAATAARLVVLGGYGLEVPDVDPAASVSIQVAARAAASVMFVRERERAGPVVVGMDGSPDAHAALRLAVIAARHRRTDLIVLHAANALCTGEAQLVRVAVHRVVSGSAEEALIRESRVASLLVIGAQGDRPTLLGSVAQTVLRHAVSPILVARAGPGRHRG